MLIATIEDFGCCPCPRCLVTKEALSDLGLPEDINRRLDQAYIRTNADCPQRFVTSVGRASRRRLKAKRPSQKVHYTIASRTRGSYLFVSSPNSRALQLNLSSKLSILKFFPMTFTRST